MTTESVLAFLRAHAPEITIIDQGASTATVAEAAVALGVEPGRIAKTLSIRIGEQAMLVVARGDARLDNAKCKAAFGGRPRMLDGETAEALTGHPVGGVCPFGLARPMPVWCDISLKDFATVFPAAGSRTTSVEIAPDRLAEVVGAGWVDVCRAAEPSQDADAPTQPL